MTENNRDTRDTRDTALAPWQAALRQGLFPLRSDDQLRALLAALESADPRLIQNASTDPPALHGLREKPCTGACLLGFNHLKDGVSVSDVDRAIERDMASITVAEIAHTGYDRCEFWAGSIVNLWDFSPLTEAMGKVAGEVREELRRRSELERRPPCER